MRTFTAEQLASRALARDRESRRLADRQAPESDRAAFRQRVYREVAEEQGIPYTPAPPSRHRAISGNAEAGLGGKVGLGG